MSGPYITLDKDLGDDPRIIALSERYAEALLQQLMDGGSVSQSGRASSGPQIEALRATLRRVARNASIGLVFYLWRYADTHIDDANMLALSLEALAEFCHADVSILKQIPSDWLQSDADNRVRLPDYANKNWLVSREIRRERGRERQQRFRDRLGGSRPVAPKPKRAANGALRATPERNTEITPPRAHDAGALPSPSPSPTLKSRNKKDSTLACEILGAHIRPTPSSAADTAEAAYRAFEQIRESYPRFTGRQDWATAQHHANHILDNKLATWADLLAGVVRYAAYVDAGGVSGAKYVLTPGRFFASRDRCWSQPWDIPATKAEAKLNANMQASAEWLADEQEKDNASK